MKKQLSVGGIISKNKEDLYVLIDKNRLEEATNLLEKILQEASIKGEVNEKDSKTCIFQLRKLVNNPSAWASTFTTWQLGGEYRVGRKKTY